jgi:GH24 family phage-related lysozyme (muramidase)
MAAINPTDNTSLIVDEFIQHATTHLLSVSGIVNTLSLYPPIPTPSPGIVNWTGYTIPPAAYTKTEIRDRIILNEILAKPDDGSVQLETDPEVNKQFNENKGGNEGYRVDPEAGGFGENVGDLVVSNIVVPAILPASLVYEDIGKTGVTASAAGNQGNVGQSDDGLFDEEGYDTEGDEFYTTLGDGNLTAADLPTFPQTLPRVIPASQGDGGTYEGGATVPLGKLSVVTGGKTITDGLAKDIGLTREQYLKSLNFADGLTITDVDMSKDWATIARQYLVKKEGFTEFATNDEGDPRLGYGTSQILDIGATQPRTVKYGDRTTREQAAKVLELQVRTTYKDKVVGTGDARISEADWTALNDRQRAACVSFVYNCGSFKFYPQIPAAIKSKNYIAAANGILNGPIAGAESGKVYSGLARRRAEEAGMFAFGL